MTPSVYLRHAAGLFVALLVLCPIEAGAGQNTVPRYKWWQSESVQKELGLTKEQVTRLEEVFQSYLPVLRKQKEALDRVEEDFNRRFDAGDHPGALALVEPVESARAALNKSRSHQLLYMRRVLTADQHAKLTALQHAARSRGDEPRPPERQR